MNTCKIHGSVEVRPIVQPGASILRPMLCPLCLMGVRVKLS